MIMIDLGTILFSDTTVSPCGTTRWMSPELLDALRSGSDGRPSRESDCYALGMTIYEVSSRILFLGNPIYPPLGTQWSCAFPPLVVARSCMRNTSRRASEKASGCPVSWFY